MNEALERIGVAERRGIPHRRRFCLWQIFSRRWRNMRDAWRTRRALERLDERMLRDIGVEPYEVWAPQPGRHNPTSDHWLNRM